MTTPNTSPPNVAPNLVEPATESRILSPICADMGGTHLSKTVYLGYAELIEEDEDKLAEGGAA